MRIWMIASARHLSRLTVDTLPPSRAATAAVYASSTALKPAMSTGGLGYAGLLSIPSCTALRRCSKSASLNLVNPICGRMTASFLVAIVVRYLLESDKSEFLSILWRSPTGGKKDKTIEKMWRETVFAEDRRLLIADFFPQSAIVRR